MSLINDMLKNLEHRTRQKPHADSYLSGLQAPPETENPAKSPRFQRLLVVTLSITVLSLSIGLAVHAYQMRQIRVAENARLQFTSPPTPTQPLNEAKTETKNSSRLNDIALQVLPESTLVQFVLSQEAFYRLTYHPELNQLDILLENTQLTVALPNLTEEHTGIQSMQALRDSAGNLKLRLMLQANVSINQIDMNTQGQTPALELSLQTQTEPMKAATDAPKTSENTTTSATQPIQEPLTGKAYQEALNLVASGRDTDAIPSLIRILDTDPHQENARVLLSKILVRAGKQDDALQLIDEGLQIQPNSADLIQLKARILVDRGLIQPALSLLMRHAPDLKTHPEYHAFMAALYQRTGKNARSAELYQSLLALRPEQGQWWVGLGIDYEALGKPNLALEAYNTANHLGNINPELQAYIDTKLQNA